MFKKYDTQQFLAGKIPADTYSGKEVVKKEV